MIVKRYGLYRLYGYDSTYKNIPDTVTNRKTDIDVFYNNLFSNGIVTNANNFPHGMSFSKNFTDTITVNIDSSYNPAEFNYIVLSPYSENAETIFGNRNVEIDKYAFYFITDYHINNTIENMDFNSVTFALVKDVWLSNYHLLLEYKQRYTTIRKHRSYINENYEFYSDEVADDIEQSNTQVILGGAEVDILYVKITLDPSHKYKINTTEGDKDLIFDLNGLYFPTVFLPIKAYRRGTNIEVNYSIISSLYGDAVIQNAIENTNTISSPYIIDASLTFVAPFEVRVPIMGQFLQTDAYVGRVYYGDTLVIGGVLTPSTYEYTNVDYSFNQSDDYGQLDSLASALRLGDFWYPTTEEYIRRIENCPERNISFENIKDITIDSYVYPYNYPVLKMGDTELPMMFNMKPRQLNIKSRCVLGGVRREVNLDVGVKILDSNTQIFPSYPKSFIPNSISAFEQFKTSNINQFNYTFKEKNMTATRDYVNTTVRGFLPKVESVTNNVWSAGWAGFTGNYGSMGTNTVSAKLGTAQHGVDSYMDMANLINIRNMNKEWKQSRIADLKNAIGTVTNLANAALVDEINQDRVRIVAKTSNARLNYIDRLYQCHKYGTVQISSTTNLLYNVRVRFDFIQTTDAYFPQILNKNERTILESVFNGGVVKWHIDETHKLNEPNSMDFTYRNEDRFIGG